MLWRSAGHSGGGLGTAENNPDNPEAAYESRLDLAWFDHFLKGEGKRPELDFSFVTDWLDFDKDAAPAVGVVGSYPAGRSRSLYLSGEDALVERKADAVPGNVEVLSSAAPTSTGGGVADVGESDADGTSASWTTPPLTRNLDVAGIPSVTFGVDAPTFGPAADPAQLLILHAKLYDVAPDGEATLVRNQVSAARIPDPSKPVTVELPGQVHRYAKGHALRVTVATSAATYRGGLGGGPVDIKAGPDSVLTIPVLGAQAGPVGSGPSGTTPFSVGSATTVARPAAKLPGRRVCRGGRRLKFRLKAKRSLRVARIRVDNRTVKTVRGAGLLRPKQVVRLSKRKARVVVVTRQRDGVKRRSARTYPACR